MKKVLLKGLQQHKPNGEPLLECVRTHSICTPRMEHRTWTVAGIGQRNDRINNRLAAGKHTTDGH